MLIIYLIPSLLADPGTRGRGFLHGGDDGGDGLQDERNFRRFLPLKRNVSVQLDAVDGILQDLRQEQQGRKTHFNLKH